MRIAADRGLGRAAAGQLLVPASQRKKLAIVPVLAVASPMAPTAVAVVVTRLAVVSPVPLMPKTLWVALAVELAALLGPLRLLLQAVISESTPAVRLPVVPTVMPVSWKP